MTHRFREISQSDSETVIRTMFPAETSEILTEQVTFLEESQLISTEMTDVVMYAVAESDEKHEDMTDLLLLGISDMFTVFEPLCEMFHRIHQF